MLYLRSKHVECIFFPHKTFVYQLLNLLTNYKLESFNLFKLFNIFHIFYSVQHPGPCWCGVDLPHSHLHRDTAQCARKCR